MVTLTLAHDQADFLRAALAKAQDKWREEIDADDNYQRKQDKTACIGFADNILALLAVRPESIRSRPEPAESKRREPMAKLVLLEDEEIEMLAESAYIDLEATEGDSDPGVVARNKAAMSFLGKVAPEKISGWDNPKVKLAIDAGEKANEEVSSMLASVEDALSQGQLNVTGTDSLSFEGTSESMWFESLGKIRALMARVDLNTSATRK